MGTTAVLSHGLASLPRELLQYLSSYRRMVVCTRCRYAIQPQGNRTTSRRDTSDKMLGPKEPQGRQTSPRYSRAQHLLHISFQSVASLPIFQDRCWKCCIQAYVNPQIFSFLKKTIMEVDLVNTQVWSTIVAFAARLEVGFRNQRAITVRMVHNFRDTQRAKLECFE